MPSVREIAKQAGVSTATVSRVINNSAKVSDTARQKVLGVISDNSYAPKIGKLSTSNLAYIFTDSTTLGSPYDAGILAGLSAGLEHNALDLLILNANTCRQNGETFDDVFRRKGVCGAIVRTTFSSRTLCRTILESQLPVVVVGDQIEGSEANCVDVDSRQASREAVEHLIELEHRRIAFCTNVIDDKDHEDRLGGFMDAHDQAGLQADPKLLFRVPASRQGGEQLARRLNTMHNPPSAIFVADPDTCIGVLNESRRIGLRVPEELSVVGFDDSDVRFSVSPALTAVCQDAKRLGEEALARVIARITDRDQETNTSTKESPLQAWFEVNASTAALVE